MLLRSFVLGGGGGRGCLPSPCDPFGLNPLATFFFCVSRTQAKQIKTVAKINEDPMKRKLREQADEILELKRRLYALTTEPSISAHAPGTSAIVGDKPGDDSPHSPPTPDAGLAPEARRQLQEDLASTLQVLVALAGGTAAQGPGLSDACMPSDARVVPT